MPVCITPPATILFVATPVVARQFQKAARSTPDDNNACVMTFHRQKRQEQ